jgi:hypothetical protein
MPRAPKPIRANAPGAPCACAPDALIKDTASSTPIDATARTVDGRPWTAVCFPANVTFRIGVIASNRETFNLQLSAPNPKLISTP